MKNLVFVSLLTGIVLFSSFKNIPQHNKGYKINDSIDSVEQEDIVEKLLNGGTVVLHFETGKTTLVKSDSIAGFSDISDDAPIDDYPVIDNKYTEPDTSTVH